MDRRNCIGLRRPNKPPLCNGCAVRFVKASRGMRITATILSTILSTTLLAQAPNSPQPRSTALPNGTAVATFARGLEHPWGLASLPDGRFLVTERPGRLRVVARDGKLSEPVKGVPQVYAAGQGGLLDVALDPKFAQNNVIYLSFAERDASGQAGTAVARGIFRNNA